MTWRCLSTRIENGVESSQIFRRKREMGWDYENRNEILWNGNGFLRKLNVVFQWNRRGNEISVSAFWLIRNFCFRVVVHGPIQHAKYVTLSS